MQLCVCKIVLSQIKNRKQRRLRPPTNIYNGTFCSNSQWLKQLTTNAKRSVLDVGGSIRYASVETESFNKDQTSRKKLLKSSLTLRCVYSCNFP